MQPMPLKSINMLIEAQIQREAREELIQRILSRDLTDLIRIHSQDKIKPKTLEEILKEIDNPIIIESEEEIIKRVEKAFGGKIKR